MDAQVRKSVVALTRTRCLSASHYDETKKLIKHDRRVRWCVVRRFFTQSGAPCFDCYPFLLSKTQRSTFVCHGNLCVTVCCGTRALARKIHERAKFQTEQSKKRDCGVHWFLLLHDYAHTLLSYLFKHHKIVALKVTCLLLLVLLKLYMLVLMTIVSFETFGVKSSPALFLLVRKKNNLNSCYTSSSTTSSTSTSTILSRTLYSMWFC